MLYLHGTNFNVNINIITTSNVKIVSVVTFNKDILPVKIPSNAKIKHFSHTSWQPEGKDPVILFSERSGGTADCSPGRKQQPITEFRKIQCSLSCDYESDH